jgi:hypothetical protein
VHQPPRWGRVLPLTNFGAYQKAAGIHALRLAGFEI